MTHTAPGAAGPNGLVSEDCARQGAVLEAFGKIIDAVGEDGDLSSVLEVLTERACRLLGVGRCAVYLLDEETGLYPRPVLRGGAQFGVDSSRRTAGVEADRFPREIVVTRLPVLVSNARRDPRPI